jgi:hypothetical protein
MCALDSESVLVESGIVVPGRKRSGSGLERKE